MPGDAFEPAFRPIQYLGSKWRILDQVSRAVESVADTRRPAAVDLFSGTGVVARRLADTRPVLATDIQEYSRVIASALLRPARVEASEILRWVDDELGDSPNSPWLRDLIHWETGRSTEGGWMLHLGADIERGPLLRFTPDDSSTAESEILRSARDGFIESQTWTLLSHYGGVFFSYKQAADMDAIARVVRRIGGAERDTVLAALLSTASDVVSSVGGHFAQPINPRTPGGDLKFKQLLHLAAVRKRDVRTVFENKLRRFSALATPAHSGLARRSSFDRTLATMPSNVGVIYADPPYTREHYSRFYHVLETIALGDDPGISTVRLGGVDVVSKGLYRVDRHQSPFSIVSEAPGAFANMFNQLASRDISIVLSYSPVPQNDKPRARVIGMEQLMDLARGAYRNVRLIEATGIRHSKFNSTSKNAPAVDEAEVLIVGSTS